MNVASDSSIVSLGKGKSDLELHPSFLDETVTINNECSNISGGNSSSALPRDLEDTSSILRSLPSRAFTDFERVGTFRPPVTRPKKANQVPPPAPATPQRGALKRRASSVSSSTGLSPSSKSNRRFRAAAASAGGEEGQASPEPQQQQQTANATTQMQAQLSSIIVKGQQDQPQLSEPHLKELCIKILDSAEERIDSLKRSRSIAYKRQEQFHKDTVAKFRATVNAVSFGAILIRSKIERLGRQLQSRRADPYIVSPCHFDPLDAANKEVCIFAFEPPNTDSIGGGGGLYNGGGGASSGSKGSGGGGGATPAKEKMLFVLDYDPKPLGPQSQSYGFEKPPDWIIYPLHVTEEFEEIKLHVESKEVSGTQPMYVVATYNLEAQQLQPVAARPLLPTAGPHFFVVSDFTTTLTTLMLEDVTKAELLENVQLLSIFACPLPKNEDLQILPPEVQVAIKKLALEALAKYLYPRLLFKQKRRWRAKLVFQTYVPPLTVETISKTGIFKTWPNSVLSQTIQVLKPMVMERGEYIIHEDENAQSGIYFLTSGSVDILKKKTRKSKAIGLSNSEILKSIPIASASNPLCFGEFAFLTEDPRMASVRATSLCMLWVLQKADFHRLFSQLPSATTNQLTNVGFEMRTKNMLKTYPLNLQILKGYSFFSRCGNDCLTKIMPLILPHAVPKGTTITKEEEPAKMFYFLRNGKCGVFRYIKERKEEIHIVTLTAPAVIGEDSVIFKVPYTATVKALTNCDLYVLAQEEFENVMVGFPAYRSSIMEAANYNRQQLLYQSQYRFKEMVLNLPFLRDMLTMTQRGELMRSFNPIVCHPREVVCSTAHFADKVLILVEGAVRIGGSEGHMWSVGEAIGWTCVVPHRWAHSAVSITSSKVIVLDMSTYARFLRSNGIYKDVVDRVKALMWPKAADANILYAAIVATQHLRSPLMYPTSRSGTANAYEASFGYRVVQYGDMKVKRDLEKREAARKKEIEAENPVLGSTKLMMEKLELKVTHGLPQSVIGARAEQEKLDLAPPGRPDRKKIHWTKGKAFLSRPEEVRGGGVQLKDRPASACAYRPNDWIKQKAAATAPYDPEEFEERKKQIRGQTNSLAEQIKGMKERNPAPAKSNTFYR